METRIQRAAALQKHKTIAGSVREGAIGQFQDITVSEAIVLGLYNQGVTKYIGIFGHGSTDIAEVLRVYEGAGLVKMYNVRHETSAAHAATALKMLTGETAAVITSIGPGAMHAFAGSLCSASNGAGVYHIYGDETTHGEGFNMQQIPKDEQGLFLKLCGIMGEAYALYEPWSVIPALRSGALATGSSSFNKPFYLLAPMNIQPVLMKDFNLLELPGRASCQKLASCDEDAFRQASATALSSKKITIKIGQGSRGCGPEIIELANLLDAAIVSGANAQGIVPYSEPRYMAVGGSKGSPCGNFAMNEADLVIVIGARAVCQWDSSGTAWKKAVRIINFNINPLHASHYNSSIALVGDAKTNLRRWIDQLKGLGRAPANHISPWAVELKARRSEWEEFKKERFNHPVLYDSTWKASVLTQPAAIKTVCDFADAMGAVKIFDAGDVQANGFQLVQDEREGQTFTDTGSSFMGFAPSALLVTAMNDSYCFALCGDGSFTMNPQILIDGIEHRARGCVVVFDNRRMSAISGLQHAQYGKGYGTNDSVQVDYIALGRSVKGVRGIYGGTSIEELKQALEEAAGYRGLSLIHVPVYSGGDDLGGLGVYGDWNVGNWCDRVQKEHHRLGF